MQTLTKTENTLNQKLLMDEIVQRLTHEKPSSPKNEAQKETSSYDSFEDAFDVEDVFEDDLLSLTNESPYSDESVDVFESFDPSQSVDSTAYTRSLASSRYGRQCGILLGVLIVSFIALLAVVSFLS